MNKHLYYNQTVKQIGFDEQGAFVILITHTRYGEKNDNVTPSKHASAVENEIKLYIGGCLWMSTEHNDYAFSNSKVGKYVFYKELTD